MIYLRLRGRIGNQLFMYSFARALQNPDINEEIVIEDYFNIPANYENSLVYYDLPNVRYVHSLEEYNRNSFSSVRRIMKAVYFLERIVPYNKVHYLDRLLFPILSRYGIFRIQDGYHSLPKQRIKFIDGYFQSEKYFESVRDELIDVYRLKDSDLADYPNFDRIVTSNTVCISIKIQHNVGSKMYDVCGLDYFAKAIKLIEEKVETPLFFICSDNVEYVKEHLIDISKYDCVIQDRNSPAHISLAVMSRCKHFIIGNTSFGWWAQYLSIYENKIVVAPSKWYGIKMPDDIYQDSWTLIEV